MHQETPLIATLVIGIVLAFILGSLAQRVRVSPIVGYLLAGWLVGPYAPGFVADQAIASELAEIGVILLMFGVGLHFSVKDLLEVKRLAIPGALLQIGAATAMGIAMAVWLGWSLGTGIVFGLALSVASTVVLLRALQQLRLLDTERGRIAVGWLIVEDLVTVLALVLIPALAPILRSGDLANMQVDLELLAVLALTIGKVVAFVTVMLVVGRRVIPWILEWAAQNGSRELFRLAVLAIAMGVALGAASLFGVSFALGAFFAGMILAESDLSQQAAEESLPLRDAFAVLFFVSVGMLFDPEILVTAPVAVLVAIGIVLVGKSVVAYTLVRVFRYRHGTAVTIAISLAQIGEFSFILIALGTEIGVIPDDARDLVLATAIVSVCLNPLLFRMVPRHDHDELPARPGAPKRTALRDHTVLIGYGRVGSTIGARLRERGEPFVVIDDRDTPARAALADGAELIRGNAADPEVLSAANLPDAKRVLVAIPQAYEAGQAVRHAREANPQTQILARAHSDADVEYLLGRGATDAVLSEREIARGMLDLAND